MLEVIASMLPAALEHGLLEQVCVWGGGWGSEWWWGMGRGVRLVKSQFQTLVRTQLGR